MKPLLALALVTGGGLVLSGGKASPRAAVCAPDDAYMQDFVASVRSIVSRRTPEANAVREGLGVPELSPAQVSVVRADSLCARAAILLNLEHHRPDTASISVYMVSLAKQYWAEDKSTAGEWQAGLVMDSTLTTIISRPGR